MIPNLSTAAFQTNLKALPPLHPPVPPTQSLYVNPARIRIGEKKRVRERERNERNGKGQILKTEVGLITDIRRMPLELA